MFYSVLKCELTDVYCLRSACPITYILLVVKLAEYVKLSTRAFAHVFLSNTISAPGEE